MNYNPKRVRCQNFTPQEEDILISLVEKYKDIIESKKNDSVLWKKKHKTWLIIHHEFSAHTDTYRSAKMLREKYDNLKKKIKSMISSEKQEANSVTEEINCLQLRSNLTERLKALMGGEEIQKVKNKSLLEHNLKEESNNDEVILPEVECQILDFETEYNGGDQQDDFECFKKEEEPKRVVFTSKKSVPKRKSGRYVDFSERADKARLIFFEKEDIRAAERHLWEKKLHEKRVRWEQELNDKKLELLNVQIERAKYGLNNGYNDT